MTVTIWYVRNEEIKHYTFVGTAWSQQVKNRRNLPRKRRTVKANK